MRVHLAKPTLRHEEEFLSAVRRSRAIHKGAVSPPSTSEAYRQYVRNLRKHSRNGFFVMTAETGEIAGVVNVSEIVRGSFQSAYLGYYALAPFAGRGLMREGLKLILDQSFGVGRLHRLEANIQPGNKRSVALVRSLGFRLEGFSPRYLKISGQWRDHERWAILADEWRGGRARKNAR